MVAVRWEKPAFDKHEAWALQMPNLKRFVTSSGYSIFHQLDDLKRPTTAIIISVVRGQENLF